MKRTNRKGPSMTKRVSMMGQPSTGSTTSKDNTLIWVIVAVLVVMFLMGSCYYNGDTSDSFGNTMISGFKNTVSKISGGSNGDLKELDIMYFRSPTCPWCKKMDQVLGSSMGDLTVIDVTTPEGQKVAKETGAADKGIPAFISKKLKTGTIGFKQSTDELVKALSKTPPKKESKPQMDPNDAMQMVQELQVVVFVSPSCGWCGKMKTELQEAGVVDMVELVDVSTEDGKQMASELLDEFRGVPSCMSRSTGKSTTGYKSLPEIVEALK